MTQSISLVELGVEQNLGESFASEEHSLVIQYQPALSPDRNVKRLTLISLYNIKEG